MFPWLWLILINSLLFALASVAITIHIEKTIGPTKVQPVVQPNQNTYENKTDDENNADDENKTDIPNSVSTNCTPAIKSGVYGKVLLYTDFSIFTFPSSTNPTNILPKNIFFQYVPKIILGETYRTRQYKTEMIKFLAENNVNNKMWTEVIVPSVAAFSIILNGYAKNDTIYEIMNIANNSQPDPTRGRSDIEKLFRIAMYYIGKQYKLKHKIYPNDVKDDVETSIETIEQTPVSIQNLNAETTNAITIPAGLYYEPKNTVGYILHENGLSKAAGIYHFCNLIDALFLLFLAKGTSKLIQSWIEPMYKRLKNAVVVNYVQLRGGGRKILSDTYRSDIVKTLMYISLINPRMNISTEYFRQLRIMPTEQIVHPYEVTIRQLSPANTSLKNNEEVVCNYINSPKIRFDLVNSASEGFSIVRYYTSVFEVACDLKYLSLPSQSTNDSALTVNEMPTGATLQTTSSDDEVHDPNSSFLLGYVNFGCDFTPLFREYNDEKIPDTIALPGWVFYDQTSQGPNTCVMVPLQEQEDTVFFSQMVSEDIRINGTMRLKAGRCMVKIFNIKPIKYQLFSWISRSPIIYTVNDNHIFMTDFIDRFYIVFKTILKPDIQMVHLMKTQYYYFGVRLTLGPALTTVSIRRHTTQKMRDPPLSFNAPTADFQNANPYVSTVKLPSGKSMIIDESTTTDSVRTPKTAVINNKTYTFTDKQLQRYILVDP